MEVQYWEYMWCRDASHICKVHPSSTQTHNLPSRSFIPISPADLDIWAPRVIAPLQLLVQTIPCAHVWLARTSQDPFCCPWVLLLLQMGRCFSHPELAGTSRSHRWALCTALDWWQWAFHRLMTHVVALAVAHQGIIQVLHPAGVLSNTIDVWRSFYHTTKHSLCSHLTFLMNRVDIFSA